MSLDPDVVNDIAAELGISPAFVEKDWHSVRALKAIAELRSDSFQTLFSGGTSLSKAYDLIQRFSEDLDFRCLPLVTGSQGQMRKFRSEYRDSVLAAVEAVGHLTLDRAQVAAASNYIKFELGYPQQYQGHSALRPGLQIEFSFTQPRLEPEQRQVQSLVSRFTGGAPEVSVLCLSPIETASDKLSALTWRVIKRDREAKDDDPAMIRHLHDLSALFAVARQQKELFLATANASFEEDMRSGRRSMAAGFEESIQAAINLLRSDREYAEEYRRFVDAMSYASDDSNIDFASAMENLKEIAGWFR